MVLKAYRAGIFPWFNEGEPVCWWSPDPRAILPLESVCVARRLRRTMRSGRFAIDLQAPFEKIMQACGEERPEGTWIHADMLRCYRALHAQGHAQALGIYRDGALVGGVYGVNFGACFAAESMFHRERDASKVALVALVEHLRRRGFTLLDVQFLTHHLEQFGCEEIPRSDYLARVQAARDEAVHW
jgi:leucyl/phenylalanyl-tRNA--protein transferase